MRLSDFNIGRDLPCWFVGHSLHATGRTYGVWVEYFCDRCEQFLVGVQHPSNDGHLHYLRTATRYDLTLFHHDADQGRI